MKVNSTNNNPNFCAIKATSSAKKYIRENFSERAIKKLDKLIEEQKENSYDINISAEWYKPYNDGLSLLKPACCCEYLKIVAGDKIFSDLNLFTSSISQIKKAIKYLSKYTQKQNFEYEKGKIVEKM